MRAALVGRLASVPDVVNDIVESVPADRRTTPPASGEWSIADIIGHVRAADAIWRPRILVALVHDGAPMPDVDERSLQAVLAGGLPLTEQIGAYTLGRRELCRVLAGLDGDAWRRTFIHAEWGRTTVEEACTTVAEHEEEHLEQLHRVRERLNP